jgi:hypothetical protein
MAATTRVEATGSEHEASAQVEVNLLLSSRKRKNVLVVVMVDHARTMRSFDCGTSALHFEVLSDP